MKKWYFILILLLFFAMVACDCQYHISGVVLDELTKRPISNVAIGKTDTADLDNPFNRKNYTGLNGDFDVYGIAGSCSEVTMYFSNENYLTKKVTLQNDAYDTIYLEPKDGTGQLFDLEKDFQIENLTKANDYPSSMEDTTICKDWKLTESEIIAIIMQSEKISGPDWHHLFDHLPCRIIGKVTQDGREFDLSLNGGSWFTISSSDTTMTFGSFKDENNKYFLSTSWMEEVE